MPKRPSKRLAAAANRHRGKKPSRPNVYVPPPKPKDDEWADNGALSTDPALAAGTATAVAQAPDTRQARQPRMVRGRQVRSRAEVYTEYLPAELRKFAILTAVMLVVLGVLTVFLR